MGRIAAGQRSAADCFALAAGLTLVAMLVYLAGRPLDTSDMWWHLALGRVYAAEGPWPDGDPLLHTAHADAPVQHEWLFGVLLHGVQRVFGFGGLRVLHVLAVAAILAGAAAAFRSRAGRGRGSLALACLAFCAFVNLAWWRLFQLRPDLLSIAAALLLYRLLLASPRAPGPGSVAAAVATLAVWANFHSLFAVGLALIAAALCGLALQAWLERRHPQRAIATGEVACRARALSAALVLGTLASLLNPRGWKQHLTFLTSSRDSAIWEVRDEWAHFDPLRFAGYAQGSVSFTSWLVTDGLAVLFITGAAWAFVAAVRRPSPATIQRFDPALFGLSLAAFVAMWVSIRFLWLSVFPLLYLLQLAARTQFAATRPAFRWSLAGVCAALVAGSSLAQGFERDAASFRGYFAQHFSTASHELASVRFLAATGLTGNLFNNYGDGGFLGYWLAPRLRTFIDSRTEHYSRDVVRDYTRINRQRGRGPGQGFLEILDDRRVDVFLGSGLPAERDLFVRAAYTTAHLDGAPGWVLVFRVVDQAIYLRRDERNRANLTRVASWYAAEGVPFDRDSGLDVEAVIATRPGWAVKSGLLPADTAELLSEAQSPDATRRAHALDRLGWAYLAAGAYRAQVAVDRAAVDLSPRAAAPRRRLVFGLLHLERSAEALAVAEAWQAQDPADPQPDVFLRTTRKLLSRQPGFHPGANRLIGELPVIEAADVPAVFANRYEGEGPSPDPARVP